MEFSDVKKSSLKILSNRKYQWAATIIILAIVLIVSSSIRVSNWDLLTDHTSGDKIPLALDPFYFLRVAETIVANNGALPTYDSLRHNPDIQTGWHPEIMPRIVVGMYRIASIFSSDVDLSTVDIISPVIFFNIGLILFFFLTYILTKKKALALLASMFLAFNPAYLYRTMAGFSDHESIGMISFFLALIIYSVGMIYIKKDETKKWGALIAGAALGFATTLTFATWSGVTNFLFIIIPVGFFLLWLSSVHDKKEAKNFAIKGIIFYVAWLIFSVLFGPLFNRKFSNIYNLFLASSNIASLAIFGFIVLDLIIIFIKPKFIKEKFRVLYSLVISGVLGLIMLFMIGRGPVELIKKVFGYLIKPFADSRFGTTVAENAQPFLNDWIGNVGLRIFWLFLFGCILFGIYLAKKIKNTKHSVFFGISYMLMIIGVVFSKYSEGSILNGDNFISQVFYIITLLGFIVYTAYLYLNGELSFTPREAVIFSLVFYTVVAGRAAARVFFAITPFVCLLAAYLVVNLYYEWKSSKEEILKIVFMVLFIIGIIVAGFALTSSFSTSSATAKVTGPSANNQWQGAMGWVRENTSEDAIFSHWWDYGYWVQSLGNRATTADGGQFQGAEDGNHKIGRYVLTTPNPKTAYSYFKSMGVTHLLIDQSDLGKYPAYSKIGSNNEWDRFSNIPVGSYDPSKVTETSDSKTFIYSFQGFVDEDINYDSNGDGKGDIFIPGPTFSGYGNINPKAYVIGAIYSIGKDSMQQPRIVYYYNGQQYEIPARYVYFNGELVDFGRGLDSVLYLFPYLRQTSGNLVIDPIGASIYLSPKTQTSLFARVYLMNDVFEDYNYLGLVHEEYDPVVTSLKRQGLDVDEFVYYQGFRGPIKIWETNYPADTPLIKEFYESFDGHTQGFGSLDSLF